jgi:hypothetical protein
LVIVIGGLNDKLPPGRVYRFVYRFVYRLLAFGEHRMTGPASACDR